MRKAVIVLIIVAILGSCDISHGATNDKQLATEWANAHGGGYTIECVNTVSKSGKVGKVKGTRWTVKYPKKVKKGKKVKVYMVEKNGEVYAMVCLGKVK